MNLLQPKVPWQKVCMDSNMMGFVPVFFALCPPFLSLCLLRNTVYWGCEGLLSALAVDTFCFNSRGISCDQHGFYDLFAPFVKAVLMQSLRLPAWVSGHLCAESFFPSHPIALQQDKWPFHSILTEGNPFLVLPDSHPRLPDTPKLGDTCGTSRASWVPSTLCYSHSNLTPSASAELSRALGGLLRSSHPAKSNV